MAPAAGLTASLLDRQLAALGSYGRILTARRRADPPSLQTPRDSSGRGWRQNSQEGERIAGDNWGLNGETMLRGRRRRLLPDQSPTSSLLPAIAAEFRATFPVEKEMADRAAAAAKQILVAL